jgi:outer membrane protein assembly factor BamB
LAWKIKLPGAGASGPITLGDKVFVTCYSGCAADRGRGGDISELVLHVVCVDRASGKTIWDTKVAPKPGESSRVRDHGYAAATPVTDGEKVYVFFGKTGVFAFDLDGKQLWNTDVGSRTSGWGCGTSPIVYKDIVIVNASVESRTLYGINKNTGDIVWRADGMQSSWNTPNLLELADGKTEVVVSVKGSILAFDPETGKRLWSCAGIRDYVCPSVVTHKGIVYAIGGRNSKCMAIRGGGRGDVSDSHKNWEINVGANVCSPVIHEGHLYWVSDRNRSAYCVNMETGKIVFQRRFPAQPYASAVVSDGKLYVVTRYDGTYVLTADSDFEELAHNKFADRGVFNASPAISNGSLFIRSNSHLYCIAKSP